MLINTNNTTNVETRLRPRHSRPLWLIFKARLLFCTFSSLQQNSSRSAAAAVWISAHRVEALLKSQFLSAGRQRAAELSNISWGFLKRLQSCSPRWGEAGMHYTFQWRWRSRCDAPTSKHHHRQIQRLSGLKYADSTELNPSHGGSAVAAVTSQEEGSGLKPNQFACSLCACVDFLPQSRNMQVSWSGNFKLPLGCESLVTFPGCVTGGSGLSDNARCDSLQPPATLLSCLQKILTDVWVSFLWTWIRWSLNQDTRNNLPSITRLWPDETNILSVWLSFHSGRSIAIYSKGCA